MSCFLGSRDKARNKDVQAPCYQSWHLMVVRGRYNWACISGVTGLHVVRYLLKTHKLCWILLWLYTWTLKLEISSNLNPVPYDTGQVILKLWSSKTNKNPLVLRFLICKMVYNLYFLGLLDNK